MNKFITIIFFISYSLSVFADVTDDILNSRKPENNAVQKTVCIDSICNQIANEYKSHNISVDSILILSDYHMHEVPEISEYCLRLIASDSPKAIGELGRLYALDNRYSDRKEDGILLLQEAIEQMYDRANLYLGIYYATQEECDIALACFNQTDPVSSGSALYCMGIMKSKGLGLTANVTEAHSYYLQSSEFGVTDAQCKVARQFETGTGCEKNLAEAFKWYYIAADDGDDLARVSLKLPRIKRSSEEYSPYNSQQLVAIKLLESFNSDRDFKEMELYSGFESSFKNNQNLALSGDPIANYFLGCLYYNGDFVDKDYSKAFNYYLAAVNNNSLHKILKGKAAYRLGIMCRYGRGVSMDPEKAEYWNKIGALNSNREAYKIIEVWIK